MKTTAIALVIFCTTQVSDVLAQTNYYATAQMPSSTQKTESVLESRVTGYYEDGYGTNVTWKRISLKIAIKTNSIGQDEITLIAYMSDSGYWTSISYASVTKTYGDISKEFTYQTYAGGKTVYFNV